MYNKLLLCVSILFILSQAGAATQNRDWVYEKISVDDKVYCQSSTSAKSESGLEGQLMVTMPSDGSELPQVEVTLAGEDISSLVMKGATVSTDRSQDSQKFYALPTSADSTDSQKLFLPLWTFESLFASMIADSRLTAELVSGDEQIEDKLVFSLFGATKTFSQVYNDCLELGKISRPIVLAKFLTENQDSFLKEVSLKSEELDLDGNASHDDFYVLSQDLWNKTQPAFAENKDLFELSTEVSINESELDALVSESSAQEQTLVDLKNEQRQIVQDQRVLPAEKERLLIRVAKNERVLPDLKEERNDAKSELDIADQNFEASEQEMARLNSSVSSKQRQLNEISNAVRNNEDLTAQNRSSLSQSENQLSRLRSSTDIRALERDLSEVEQLWARASERLDNFNPKRKIQQRLRKNDRYQEASDKLENIGAERASLQAEQRTKDSQLSKTSQKVKSLSQKIRSDQQILKTIDSEISALKVQKTNNLARNNQLNEKRKEAVKRKKEHEWVYKEECSPITEDTFDFCDEKQRLIKVEAGKINRIDKETKKVISQRAKIEAQIVKKKNQKSTLPGAIAHAQQKLGQEKAKMTTLQSELKSIREQLSGFRARIERLKTTKRSIEDRVTNEVNGRYNDLVREESSLSREAGDLADDVNSYRNTEANLVADINELLDSIDGLEAQYSALVERESTLQSQLSSAESARDRYARSSEYKQAKVQYDNASEDYDQALAAYNKVRDELGVDQARVDEIDDTLDAHLDRIDAVKEGIVSTEETILTLQAEVEEKQEVVEKLTSEKTELQSSNDEKVIELVETEKELSEELVAL